MSSGGWPKLAQNEDMFYEIYAIKHYYYHSYRTCLTAETCIMQPTEIWSNKGQKQQHTGRCIAVFHDNLEQFTVDYIQPLVVRGTIQSASQNRTFLYCIPACKHSASMTARM